MTTVTRSQVDMLNRATPAARRAGVGTKMADLITQFNSLRASVASMWPGTSWVATPATLAIEGGKKKVETTSEFNAMINGTLVTKAAGTDMPTLPTGNLATLKAAAYYFDVVANGTVTATKTADAATKAAAILLLPAVAANTVRIGYIVVENGTADNFVGNTTDLDTALVTVTYVNTAALGPIAATAVAPLTTSPVSTLT